MAHNTLLFLSSTPRHVARAIKEVLKDEEYDQVNSAARSLKLLQKSPRQVRLFAVVKNLEWVAVGLYASHFDLTLAKAIAQISDNSGFLLKKGAAGRTKNELYQVKAGQTDDQPKEMSNKKVEEFLVSRGIGKKLIELKVADHLVREDVRAGKHEDIILGFIKSRVSEPSEVQRVLGTASGAGAAKKQSYSLDEFLALAVKHKKVRAIAKAQILEQLKRDGFYKELVINNPEPQGHYCEAFEAESYSFASNGPYVWLEWSCEEACEPHLSEELAFPSCDLKFSLEKSTEV